MTIVELVVLAAVAVVDGGVLDAPTEGVVYSHNVILLLLLLLCILQFHDSLLIVRIMVIVRHFFASNSR